MAEEKVQRVQTNITEPQMAQALITEFTKLEGQPPTKAQLALLIAQNNLETGHRKSMWNWNVGNITHKKGDGFNYWEGLDWLYKSMPDAVSGITRQQKVKQNQQYRAYPNLEAGVRDYLLFLKRVGGGSVWKKILQGDPVAFSKALKGAKYYTANEQDTIDENGKRVPGYTSGIVAQFNAFNKRDSYEKAISGQVTTPQQPHEQQVAYNTSTIGKMVENFINEVMKYVG